MEIFDYLKCLTETKKEINFDNDEINKGYQPYMINRFISMIEVYLPFVIEANKYDLPKNIHYNFFNNILPKRKQYFNYLKKKKDVDLQSKKYIADYFQVGLKEAEEYCNILKDDQIKEILKIYKYGKNNMIEV